MGEHHPSLPHMASLPSHRWHPLPPTSAFLWQPGNAKSLEQTVERRSQGLMPPSLPAKGVECPSDYRVHRATAPPDPPSHPQELGIGVATVPRDGCSVPEVTVLSRDTLGGPGLALGSQKWPWCPDVGCGVPGMAAVPKANQISRGWILSGVSGLSWQQPQCPRDGWDVPGWL